jgi:hypothetical protein
MGGSAAVVVGEAGDRIVVNASQAFVALVFPDQRVGNKRGTGRRRLEGRPRNAHHPIVTIAVTQ